MRLVNLLQTSEITVACTCAFQLIDLTEILALFVAVDQEIRAVQSAEYAGIALVKKVH